MLSLFLQGNDDELWCCGYSIKLIYKKISVVLSRNLISRLAMSLQSHREMPDLALFTSYYNGNCSNVPL